MDFASAAKKGSAIAQLGGDKNAVAGAGALAGRTIVAKTTRDSIGNVGRLAASRDVNNAVREHFMRTTSTCSAAWRRSRRTSRMQ